MYLVRTVRHKFSCTMYSARTVWYILMNNVFSKDGTVHLIILYNVFSKDGTVHLILLYNVFSKDGMVNLILLCNVFRKDSTVQIVLLYVYNVKCRRKSFWCFVVLC